MKFPRYIFEIGHRRLFCSTNQKCLEPLAQGASGSLAGALQLAIAAPAWDRAGGRELMLVVKKQTRPGGWCYLKVPLTMVEIESYRFSHEERSNLYEAAWAFFRDLERKAAA